MQLVAGETGREPPGAGCQQPPLPGRASAGTARPRTGHPGAPGQGTVRLAAPQCSAWLWTCSRYSAEGQGGGTMTKGSSPLETVSHPQPGQQGCRAGPSTPFDSASRAGLRAAAELGPTAPGARTAWGPRLPCERAASLFTSGCRGRGRLHGCRHGPARPGGRSWVRVTVPALRRDSPGHGPDWRILYPKLVPEGRAPRGGWLTWPAGLTALQGT